MSGLSTATYQEIRGALLECGPIGTDQELRAVFSHPLLRPWRNRVPQSYSPTGRVDAVIDFLHNKANTDGANALVLFLTVLSENTRLDGETACQQRLLSAAAAMAAETGTQLPEEAVRAVAAATETGESDDETLEQRMGNIILEGGTVIFYQSQGGEIRHVGDVVQGEKKTGDEINISGGDFRAANVNIKSKLENVTETINALPHADDKEREQLQQLVTQLEEELAQAPPEQANDAEKVATRVEALLEEANDDNPDTEMMEITGESLKRAAENVRGTLPAVAPIATLIASQLAGKYVSAEQAEQLLKRIAETEFTPGERIVNTGFAPGDRPKNLLDPQQALEAGRDYFFWLQVTTDKPMSESAEVKPAPLPQQVHEGAQLTVVLFFFEDGLQPPEDADDADMGEIEIIGSGARVLRQPVEFPDDWPDREARLYFPVRVPDKPGTYRLRCGIYWGQLLLQSRLITANAVAPGITGALQRLFKLFQRQLRADIDYTISNQLEPGHLKQLEPEEAGHRLSLMLNSNGDATHNIHVFGRDGERVVKGSDLRFGEMELAEMIENARRKLRRASWGYEEEYQDGWEYRYGEAARELQAWREDRPGGEVFIKKLSEDLAAMAKSGYRFYDKLVGELSEDDPKAAEALERLLVRPGMLQVAFRRSIRHLLPAALIYDYPLWSPADVDQFSLCDKFTQALKDGANLLQTACWQGACPAREELAVVCPSGFWGFRHYLGMPLTLCDEYDNGGDGPPCPVPDPPAFIAYGDELRLGIGVATHLSLWEEHEAALRQLQPSAQAVIADDIDELLQFLNDPPHVLYFYCHGGLDDGAATLELGPPDLPVRIDRTVWSHAQWTEPRPLVFINGCHTTAVTPEKAMDLVEPLLRRAHAAGVIGTEVTIFEPLATRFAESCFRHFFAGVPIGRAIRDARVEILQNGNPLGLVYIPFVLAGLRLHHETES